jgi:hypothetical protein
MIAIVLVAKMALLLNSLIKRVWILSGFLCPGVRDATIPKNHVMQISELRHGYPCRRSTILDSVDPTVHRISELSLSSDRSPRVSLDGRSRFLRDFSLTLFATRHFAVVVSNLGTSPSRTPEKRYLLSFLRSCYSRLRKSKG